MKTLKEIAESYIPDPRNVGNDPAESAESIADALLADMPWDHPEPQGEHVREAIIARINDIRELQVAL